MDRIYRHQRHIYDASRKFYLLGRDELIERLSPQRGACVLEIGCGTGRNLVKLARAYPQARFCGIDISAEMLETAGRSVARAGLASRISLARADATRFDPQALFGRDRFERIVISYALSMIPPWQAALNEAARHLAPGGSLHIVDFGDQAGLPAAFSRALNRWLHLFHVSPRRTLPAELASLAGGLGLVARTESRFCGYAVYAVAQRPFG
jgi:S-adenosylmethionine-diacylgycerolhomoserine-N-methlytransferase